MRTIALFITLLAVAPQAVTDQKPVVPEGTTIDSVQVTGFDIDRLSPGLREEIRNLAGTPLTQQRLDELAARIEAERPRYVVAARSVMDPDGRARVFFVMGRQDQPDRDDNINTRYIVEDANIIGVSESDLTQALRDDLRALVGKRLDSPEAGTLQERLGRDLPDYDVSRRILRGSEPGRIRLVYEARRKEAPHWLRFEPLRSNVVYHSDQGWGSYIDFSFGHGAIRLTPIFAIDNSDDLVEEYSGFGLRFETRKLATRRLGASFEWSQFEQDWRAATLDALALKPGIPPAYEKRSTITPLLKFAFTPQVSIAAGVSVSELELLSPATDSQMANAAVASISYNGRLKDASDATHRFDANFGVRAGSRALDSDLAYTRYLGQGSYRYDVGRHHLQVAGMAGGITGHPPLFERFTLGDSTTLRGWDKYDIAPAGGDRVAYSSIEYRYTGLALFLDVGSVWDAHTERDIRVSTGFGFHAGPAFFVVGFPLNTDELRAVFTMGLRTSGIGITWR
ncbi:MAG TPA: BamA/TamA family outer membrane protein [Vicinamibacterales bacterium]|nr:BamA/TamA family outer membrane protein [Vicinamibacterales bacterium]